MVYLDNAATTPLNTAAISAMTHVMTETFGNPSMLTVDRLLRNFVKPVKKSPNTLESLLVSLFSLLVGLKETIQLSKVTP